MGWEIARDKRHPAIAVGGGGVGLLNMLCQAERAV
jgi:hypothetical protein